MCKVTCLIKNNNIVLTSSRDISINRKHSFPPKRFKYNNNKLIMPYDPQGHGTWIGAGAKIIGKVNIGRNCVIGAHTIVFKDVPDYCVVVGAPARIIKQYDIINKNWITVNKSLG